VSEGPAAGTGADDEEIMVLCQAIDLLPAPLTTHHPVEVTAAS